MKKWIYIIFVVGLAIGNLFASIDDDNVQIKALEDANINIDNNITYQQDVYNKTFTIYKMVDKKYNAFLDIEKSHRKKINEIRSKLYLLRIDYSDFVDVFTNFMKSKSNKDYAQMAIEYKKMWHYINGTDKTPPNINADKMADNEALYTLEIRNWMIMKASNLVIKRAAIGFKILDLAKDITSVLMDPVNSAIDQIKEKTVDLIYKDTGIDEVVINSIKSIGKDIPSKLKEISDFWETAQDPLKAYSNELQNMKKEVEKNENFGFENKEEGINNLTKLLKKEEDLYPDIENTVNSLKINLNKIESKMNNAKKSITELSIQKEKNIEKISNLETDKINILQTQTKYTFEQMNYVYPYDIADERSYNLAYDKFTNLVMNTNYPTKFFSSDIIAAHTIYGSVEKNTDGCKIKESYVKSALPIVAPLSLDIQSDFLQCNDNGICTPKGMAVKNNDIHITINGAKNSDSNYASCLHDINISLHYKLFLYKVLPENIYYPSVGKRVKEFHLYNLDKDELDYTIGRVLASRLSYQIKYNSGENFTDTIYNVIPKIVKKDINFTDDGYIKGHIEYEFRFDNGTLAYPSIIVYYDILRLYIKSDSNETLIKDYDQDIDIYSKNKKFSFSFDVESDKNIVDINSSEISAPIFSSASKLCIDNNCTSKIKNLNIEIKNKNYFNIEYTGIFEFKDYNIFYGSNIVDNIKRKINIIKKVKDIKFVNKRLDSSSDIIFNAKGYKKVYASNSDGYAYLNYEYLVMEDTNGDIESFNDADSYIGAWLYSTGIPQHSFIDNSFFIDDVDAKPTFISSFNHNTKAALVFLPLSDKEINITIEEDHVDFSNYKKQKILRIYDIVAPVVRPKIEVQNNKLDFYTVFELRGETDYNKTKPYIKVEVYKDNNITFPFDKQFSYTVKDGVKLVRIPNQVKYFKGFIDYGAVVNKKTNEIASVSKWTMDRKKRFTPDGFYSTLIEYIYDADKLKNGNFYGVGIDNMYGFEEKDAKDTLVYPSGLKRFIKINDLQFSDNKIRFEIGDVVDHNISVIKQPENASVSTNKNIVTFRYSEVGKYTFKINLFDILNGSSDYDEVILRVYVDTTPKKPYIKFVYFMQSSKINNRYEFEKRVKTAKGQCTFSGGEVLYEHTSKKSDDCNITFIDDSKVAFKSFLPNIIVPIDENETIFIDNETLKNIYFIKFGAMISSTKYKIIGFNNADIYQNSDKIDIDNIVDLTKEDIKIVPKEGTSPYIEILPVNEGFENDYNLTQFYKAKILFYKWHEWLKEKVPAYNPETGEIKYFANEGEIPSDWVKGVVKDSDNDGINDILDKKFGLDLNDPSDALSDNDNDGLSNKDEILIYHTNPNIINKKLTLVIPSDLNKIVFYKDHTEQNISILVNSIFGDELNISIKTLNNGLNILKSWSDLLKEAEYQDRILNLKLSLKDETNQSSDILTIQIEDEHENIKIRELNITILKDINFYAEKGWRLKSIPINKEINASEFKDIVILWKWDKKSQQWLAFSPDSKIKEILEQYQKNGKIGLFTQIKPTDGFWMYSNKSQINNFKGNTYGLNSIDFIKGWNLVGTGENIKIDDIATKAKIKYIWKYENNNWKLWEKNIVNEAYQKYKRIDLIRTSDGFWVYVE